LLTLAVGCLAAFGPAYRAQRKQTLWALAGVWAIGAGAEIVGLVSGYPFGKYRYTDRWWPTVDISGVGTFPLQLPFAWALVVGSTYLVVAPRIKVGAVWVTAAIATVLDQAMEPTMTHVLGYWTWSDHGPLAAGSPVSNAVGWFVVSLLAAWAMRAILGKAIEPDSSPGVVLLAYLCLIIGLGVIVSP
jgi:uncharacterized membrane protein